MQSLLATLSALQVKIEARDGKLHVNAPAGVLTPELKQEISLHRDALIERLQASSLPVVPREELPLIVPDPEHGHEPFPLNTCSTPTGRAAAATSSSARSPATSTSSSSARASTRSG